MNIDQLQAFIKAGENSTTEFKSSFTDEVVETLVAFANTKGGNVLVGITNKGLPVSNFNIGNETFQNWTNEIKTRTI